MMRRKKVVYLAITYSKHQRNGEPAPRSILGTMPIRNWKATLNRFMIELEDCLIDYV